MPQFLRSYKLIIGSPGGQGVVITNLNDDNTYKRDALRISFTIDKDTTKKTNKSKIKIWNLSDDTLDIIEKDDIVVELWAGYFKENNMRRIFVGYAMTIETKNDNNGKDIVTEINASDGQISIRDSIMSVGYPPGINSREIINGIATTMGLALFTAPDVVFPDYPDGFSYVGKAADALDVVCGVIGAAWSIQNEVLQIIMSDGTTGMRGFVFGPNSGLLDYPEHFVRSAYASAAKQAAQTAKTAISSARKKRKKDASRKKDRKQKKYGWRIKALLNPSVNPGDAIRIESSFVSGWFKLEAVKHEGDSHGKDWYSTMDCIEVMLDDE